MRRERRDLLPQVGMLACGAQIGLSAVQNDGFEAVAAVVAAILEDRHSIYIIGKARVSGIGYRVSATGNRQRGAVDTGYGRNTLG
jgi:hypothetical protein